MSRDQIISTLYSGDNFKGLLTNLAPENLRDELGQEVIMVICEMPEDKLLKLHQDEVLAVYVVRIAMNMIRGSKYAQFTKKFKPPFVELTNKEIADDSDLEGRQHREIMEDKAIAEIDNLYWYDQQLIGLYKEHGNYRALERETKIPWQSCYDTIRNSFKKIKSKVV